MKESINEVRADAPHTLTVYNIRDDNEPNVKYWRRKFQYDIPVLYLRRDAPTHADDMARVRALTSTYTEIARHRIDAATLRKRIKELCI